jgi:hypothetical protein
MDQILPPGLNDLGFEALRQLAAHPITFHIPSDIESRLKNIGRGYRGQASPAIRAARSTWGRNKADAAPQGKVMLGGHFP